MIVRMLAIKWIVLAFTLASAPEPNAGSYDAGDKLTIGSEAKMKNGQISRWRLGSRKVVEDLGRTAREEPIFAQDGDCIDEENGDVEKGTEE